MTEKVGDYFEGVAAQSEAFVLTGSDVTVVNAGDGNDFIQGNTGVNFLIGGFGSDVIIGAANINTIYGDNLGLPTTGSPDLIIGGVYGDTIYGGNGNDFINGRDGADGIDGGADNDIIWGGFGADVVHGGAGHDDIYGTSAAAAPAGLLTINTNYNGLDNTGPLVNSPHGGSAGALSNAGDFKGDTLFGGTGNDKLHGHFGVDFLTGGQGFDQFVFDYSPQSNTDFVTDFVVKYDTIAVDNAFFGGVGPAGALAAQKFWKGGAAHDASDRIVYNPNTGALFIDGDGTGNNAPIYKFAILDTGLKLTAADFLVI